LQQLDGATFQFKRQDGTLAVLSNDITGQANTANTANSLAMTVNGSTCAELFANTLLGSTSICEIYNAADAPAAGWWMIESVRHSNGANLWGVQTARGWESNAGVAWERSISSGAWSPWRRIIIAKNSGNVLIGAATDNGVDKLQVNGSVKSNNLNTFTKNIGIENNFVVEQYLDIGGDYEIVGLAWLKDTTGASTNRFKLNVWTHGTSYPRSIVPTNIKIVYNDSEWNPGCNLTFEAAAAGLIRFKGNVPNPTSGGHISFTVRKLNSTASDYNY
jgi:hypothetical protein